MSNRNRRRLVTVLLAPAAALVACGIARLFEIDLAVSTGTVGAGDVVAAALAGASAGWLVALLVERRSRRPRATWAFVGSTALSVSIVGPSWLADGAAAVALIALHLVVAVVVIAGFARTMPVCDPAR